MVTKIPVVVAPHQEVAVSILLHVLLGVLSTEMELHANDHTSLRLRYFQRNNRRVIGRLMVYKIKNIVWLPK